MAHIIYRHCQSKDDPQRFNARNVQQAIQVFNDLKRRIQAARTEEYDDNHVIEAVLWDEDTKLNHASGKCTHDRPF